MHSGRGTTEEYMKNIITTVRKAVAPIKTTSRALGIFQKALDALEEVRDNQQARRNSNWLERQRLTTAIQTAEAQRDALDDDNANAMLEEEAAAQAIQQINRLLTPAAVPA